MSRMAIAPPDLTSIFQPLLESLGRDERVVVATGLAGSSKALAIAAVAQTVASPVVIITSTQLEAERLTQDLAFFADQLGMEPGRKQTREQRWSPLLFPETELLPYQWSSAAPDLVAERLATLADMSDLAHVAGLAGPVVVTSARAALQRLLPKSLIREATVRLEKGQAVDRDDLVGRLIRIGYRPVPQIDRPGQISIRGGIVDVFSPAREVRGRPVRIEMAGDTVESLRLFEPSTQRSLETIEAARLIPARECFTGPADLDRARRAMRRRLGDTDLPPAALERQLTGLTTLPPGTEWLAPFFHDRLETFGDYLAGGLLIVDEPDAVEHEAAGLARQAEEGYAGAVRAGLLVPRPDEWYTDALPRTRQVIQLSALGRASGRPSPHVYVTKTPAALGIGQAGATLSATCATLRTLQRDHAITIVCQTPDQQQRLHTLCAEHDLPASLAPLPDASAFTQGGPVIIMTGSLTRGVFLPDLKTLCLTEEELLGKPGRQRPARTKARDRSIEAFLPDLATLKAGDPVVHLTHGIGRYHGLERIVVDRVQGIESEYVVITYLGGDRLLVPIDRLDLLQPYVGMEERIPRLDRLGGTRWTTAQQRTQRVVEAVAKELLDLYAARRVATRPAFSPDDAMAHEFAAAFEYDETDDQLAAIEEVRMDMESGQPMDRLICGDVGYGKTEVAMRAAFKAVADSKQVAVLVPTTLLAQQHLERFRQRLARLPIRIEMLSRFVSPTAQEKILDALRQGVIDIIIGTHRLLQADVTIPRLGLLIVDEEQRFGVRHKERLTQWRQTVDVLTLTATPIPRTLQLSLAGVRNLSVLTTPPVGRLSIRTSLIGFETRVIREAILRELGRGGQVFFVHNRIQTIPKMAELLRRLVPEARLEIVHGQMPERQLETVMHRFLSREADLLLTTSIIASGLDIPSANTIVIDRADLFGLADLHQLRGRVGRADEQAYAYLIIPESGEGLTEQARQRLEAIQEFITLGASFRLAARDLEIRGAGTLLGMRQAGHIAAVGLEFYLHLLEQAVRAARGEAVHDTPEPTLNLRTSAYFPESYIHEAPLRLAAYKRLATIRTAHDLAAAEAELTDRYGPPPEPARRLLQIVSLKRLCREAGVSRLDARERDILLVFDDEPRRHASETRLAALVAREGEWLAVQSPTSLSLRAEGAWETVEPVLQRILTRLVGITEHAEIR